MYIIYGVKEKNFTPFGFFMEEKIYYAELFEIYKGLLTAKQKEVFEMHFLLDFSLAEISEEKGISRQNVNDAISSAKKKLEELERELKVKNRNDLLKELEKQADSFNINQRICDRVMLNNGKNVYVRELLEFNQELHDNMCDMVEQCKEFIEEYIAA